jgi:hypothetical protein
MKSTSVLTIAVLGISLTAIGGRAISAQDKCTVQVPSGLALSECRGYGAGSSSRSVRTDRWLPQSWAILQ